MSLSITSRDQIYRVRKALHLDKGSQEEFLWTLRIALAVSLQTGVRDPEIVALTEKTQGSKDPLVIRVSTLEQKDSLLFRALLQQFYQKRLDDDEYSKYLKRHIEHGLRIIDEGTKGHLRGYEYLVSLAKRGMIGAGRLLGASGPKPILHSQQQGQEGYDNIITVQIGTEKSTSKPYIVNFNKTDEHNNNHVGIIGRPGSGKTYFVKYLLTKLRETSAFQTNFIIFDYAKGDIADDQVFINNTRAELIDVSKQPIPLNVFQLQEDYSERGMKRQAERIVRIVRDVEANIGKVQEQNLYHAILKAYESMRSRALTPDFHIVREELEVLSPKPDSLTSVFRPLTEHNLFASYEMPIWEKLTNRTVIFDIHKLPASKDLCVFLVLSELHRQLMLLPDSGVDPNSKARQMRTIVVIDEAHHFLRNKKRVKVLETLIREIRSKGASVMLLSQSPDDYDQDEFNFLELLEFVYVLGCNPSSAKFFERTFGISSIQAKQLLQEVTTLNQGDALAKGKDGRVVRLELCK